MNTANPYESPTTSSSNSPAKFSVACATTLWIVLPILFFGVRSWVGPIFADFGTELPVATRALFHPAATLLIPAFSVALILAIAFIRNVHRQRIAAVLAFAFGLIVGLLFLVSFLLPLASLMQNLR